MNSNKIQFEKFVSQASKVLTSHERKLISLIMSNFSEIESKGVAAGSRARYIAGLQVKNQYQPYVDTSNSKLIKSKGIKRLLSLTTNGFRGFSKPETFDLDKGYTFLYGPNGTGKSSFCESLEYALTGKIHEATQKKFDPKKYILNKENKKQEVSLLVEFSDGTNGELKDGSSENEFMFIERNRIEGFARVSSYAAQAQQQRLSSLFGLESFNKFCSGFSNSIQNNLPLDTPKANLLLQAESAIKSQRQQLEAKQKEIQGYDAQKSVLLNKYPEQTQVTELITYLCPESGLIKKKRDELDRHKTIKLRETDKIDTYKQELEQINLKNSALIVLREFISTNSEKINFLNLYSSIDQLINQEVINKDTCPACDTPIENVTTNPFSKASSQLVLLKELADKQKNEKRIRNEINTGIASVDAKLKAIGITAPLNLNRFDLSYLNSIKVINTIRQQWVTENKKNAPLMKQIENVQSEIIQLEKDLSEARALTELYRNAFKLRKGLEAEINVFTEKNKILTEDVHKEKLRIDSLKVFENNYQSLISKLKKYNDELPISLAQQLGDMTLKIYNSINNHDYDHEVITKLTLPTSSSEIIKITFIDGYQDDALRILSEGHLRCLGLAILLAKNIHDGHGILIFDDVVNAIDDEHRTGIIDELFGNHQLREKQIILTTHGEDFLKRLENRIPSKEVSKKLSRYDFKRNYEDRSVVIKKDQNRHYLVKAEAALKDGRVKDSLMECRRTLEGLTIQLWKKIAKERLDSSLNVQLRQPNAQPDLYTLVSGLIKCLSKIEKTPGITSFVSIKENLMTIQDSSKRHNENWTLLNKGTHEEDRDEEFDERQASDLIKLLVELESSIKGYIQPKDLCTA